MSEAEHRCQTARGREEGKRMQGNRVIRPHKRSAWSKLIHSWQLYVLLLPALVYIIVFHYVPIYGLQIAFREFKPKLGFTGSQWVGLKHFQRFVTSPQFPTLMRNTLKLSFYSLLFSFPVPVLLALMLNECDNLHYKKLVQNVTYAPHFISTVVVCGMVIMFLTPETGIINNLVVRMGGKSVDYMGKEEWFRPIYIISDIWKNTGWSSIIYLAALSGIDPQLHESAQIDGANRLQRIWHINLPGIRGTIILLLILDCGKIMSVGFEKAYLLQNALNLPQSEIISTYVYKTGVIGTKFSYTSAIGLFNSIINVILLLITNRISSKVSGTSLF